MAKTTKLTPTEIAVEAAKSARASAEAASKVADSVLSSVESMGEFRGYMRSHLETQSKLNEGFTLMLTNHMPHLQRDVGEIGGEVKLLKWAMGIIITLIIVSGIVIPLVS